MDIFYREIMKKDKDFEIKINFLELEIEDISERMDDCDNQDRYWDLGHLKYNLENKINFLKLYLINKDWFNEWLNQ